MTRFLLLPFLFVAISGHAATLVVDTTTTAPALNACTAAPLDCSFAGALSLANQDAAQDTIAFAIPFTEAGCDPVLLSCFVSLVSAPPLSVTQPVIIDGTTQPGHVANSLSAVNGGLNGQWSIELGGNRTSFFVGGAGLKLHASTLLRGLKFVDNHTALSPSAPSGKSIVIEGCAFGGSRLGKAANAGSYRRESSGAAAVGIDQIQFGGLLPAQRNWAVDGYVMIGETADAVTATVQGNVFGLKQDGSAIPVVGGLVAEKEIFFNSAHAQSSILVGGTDANARNLIATGFYADGKFNDFLTPPRMQVLGNWFYIAANGTPLSPQFRVELNQGGVAFGGDAPGAANLVQGGVMSREGRNPIRGNQFVGSRGRPIWLFSPAVNTELNDAGDADQAVQLTLQNYPEIRNVVRDGSNVSVTYRVDSAPANSAYPLRIEFYLGDSDDGETLLGHDLYLSAEAQQSKTVIFQWPASHAETARTRVMATATTTEDAPQTSMLSLFPVSLTVLASAGSGYPDRGAFVATARVTLVYPGAATYPDFAYGRVKFRSSGGGQPDSVCVADLVPTPTSGVAAASCALPATAAPLAVGQTRTLKAHFDPDVNPNIDSESPLIDELRGPYTGSNGQPHPQTQVNLVVVGDRLFCNGYETGASDGCPQP